MINKNLPIKPNKGGIPAKDSKLKKTIIYTKLNKEKFLNWLSVLNLFKSNKKKTLNNKNNKIKYIIIFKSNKLKPYSAEILKFKKFKFSIFKIHE